jgi:hypothetical protein
MAEQKIVPQQISANTSTSGQVLSSNGTAVVWADVATTGKVIVYSIVFGA